MELRRYLAIIRHRLPLVIVTVLVALACGYLLTPRTPLYSATSVIYVGQQGPDLNPNANNLTANYQQGLSAVIATWSLTIKSPSVISQALADAKVNRSVGTVAGETTASQVAGTYLMNVTVTDPDPAIAQQLSIAVTKSFVKNIQALSEGHDTQQFLNILSNAQFPAAPNPSGLVRNLALSGVLGLLAALGVVSLLEYLDITIRNAEDAERRLGLPVLGSVPLLGDRLPTSPVARVDTPRDARARERRANGAAAKASVHHG